MSTDLKWFKSSYSGDQGGECVEIAIAETPLTPAATIHIRDSKALTALTAPAAPTLKVTPATWSAFLPVVQALDLPE
ncbi:DUF397 domain-containing protein [Streptomyces sp. BV286]|uniref:DUF397 domain-containing protein n=1 Tax=Streptomyces sp. BV286 TaxID=2849672 RepID=UPI001C2E5783|nr:DUF397 domain-containing protein [Streptomyces sp. BV286]MBV1936749.1 DUF397 domain-containing protein [Streptomyces sp. BV286]